MSKINLRELKKLLVDKCHHLKEADLIISTIGGFKIGLIGIDKIKYGYLPRDNFFRKSIFKPIGENKDIVYLDHNKILITTVKCYGSERLEDTYISEKIGFSSLFSKSITGSIVLNAIKNGFYLGGADKHGGLPKKIIFPVQEYFSILNSYKPIVMRGTASLDDTDILKIDRNNLLKKLFIKRYGSSLESLYNVYKELYSYLTGFKQLNIGMEQGIIKIGDSKQSFIELRKASLFQYTDKSDIIILSNDAILEKIPPPYLYIDISISQGELVLY